MARKTKPTWETEQGIFPRRLRELMDERGVTQRMLAEVIGMRPQTVSLYVTGQSVPDINCLFKLAAFFEVSADWLIGRPNCPKTINGGVAEAMACTGLSEAAVDKVSHFGDRKLKDGVVKNKTLREVLNSVLEDSRFEQALIHVSGAVQYANKKPIEEGTTARELVTAIGTVNGFGLEVLPFDEARQYHLQQAAIIFTDIVRDIQVGEDKRGIDVIAFEQGENNNGEHAVNDN